VARARAAHPGRPVEVWAEDEHRVGLKPIRRRVWAPVGARPVALGHHRYEWLHVTAFVQPTSGEAVWYLSTGLSKPLFEALLAAFARQTGAGRRRSIVLVLDNAGWHGPEGLAIPDGISLVFLPPYSPELQPAERLWPLVDEPIVNRHFATLAQLDATVAERCRSLDAATIRPHTNSTGAQAQEPDLITRIPYQAMSTAKLRVMQSLQTRQRRATPRRQRGRRREWRFGDGERHPIDRARLEICRTRTEGVTIAQAQVHRAQAQYVASVEYMLEGVFLLRQRMAPARGIGLRARLSISPGGGRRYHRLLLLLFPGGSLTPTTLRRYAGTVWLAECEGIAWHDLSPFVHRNGGVARCGDRAPRQLFE
jgi:hypothetical protein